MKKKALTQYIRCVRSMHMRSALYAEMMDTLGVSEQPEPVVQAKKESVGWLRFQRIAAVSVCLFGCGGNRSRDRRFEMGEISGRLGL